MLERGFELLKLKEFMIQSLTGKTHAINPKNNKTYCGHPQTESEVNEHALETLGWRFLDIIPARSHEPTCQICKNHYNDPYFQQMGRIQDDLEEQIHEWLALRIILKDTGAIGRFTGLIAKFIRSEVKKAKVVAE